MLSKTDVEYIHSVHSQKYSRYEVPERNSTVLKNKGIAPMGFMGYV